ncbi:putative F-box/FBD/LRR-repeat protein [Cardamine amara subsp. amara]|uniref:F-box/FBD/LRR-repeat protein n=1 Tax=Cardamine amara subsp. amara TaxID=228776 RepID=A0ABD1C3I9_CARAN
MEFNHGSHMQNFKLRQYYHFDRVNELIRTVVDRGIHHLDVTMIITHRYDLIPQNIYKSKTLVSLKLENVVLKIPEFAVSLPCLKIMYLFNVCYGKDGPLVVENLISECPVLDDLELFRPSNISNKEVLLFLRVRSQTLKICFLRFPINSGRTDFKVEIDSRRL